MYCILNGLSKTKQTPNQSNNNKKDSMTCRVIPHCNYCRGRSTAGSDLLCSSKTGFFPSIIPFRWYQCSSVKAMRFLEKNLFLIPSRWGKAHLDGMFPLFQSTGTSPNCCSFSNMEDSGLETSSSSSLRTHRCISSGPISLCTFRLLRCSWTWSSPTVGCCHSSGSPALPSAAGMGGALCDEDWGKNMLLSASAFLIPR